MNGARSLARAHAVIAGTAISAWAGTPVAIKILISVMAADVLTGICRACVQGRLNSNASFSGFMKKAAMLIVVTLGHILDSYVTPTPHVGSWLAMAFTATEGFSIMENLSAIGVPVPDRLRDVFFNMDKQAKGGRR